MICSICNGYVKWKGPLVNLTHTECHGCGAINSQVAEFDEGEYEAQLAEDLAAESQERMASTYRYPTPPTP